jgi:hypothetical protein
MASAIFLYANADEDHEHDEGDDALFFWGESEKAHRCVLAELVPPARLT